MITDSDDFFEDLSKSFPELMQLTRLGDTIDVDAGWFNIIRQLCASISAPLDNSKHRLRAANQYPRDDNGVYLLQCQVAYEVAKQELPVIVQIKEKFGTLRIYVDNSSDRVDTLIGFAEAMSSCTCEVCGKPGKIDHGSGWLKVHCNEHQYEVDNVSSDLDGKIMPMFQDDET